MLWCGNSRTLFIEINVDKQEILKLYAFSLAGLPYRWGGDTPMDGFDCSGLVLELLKSQGLWPATEDCSSQDLFMYFVKQGPKAFAKFPDFGSILFFGKDAKQISHTAFALGQTLMLEAGGGTAETTSLQAAVKQKAFIKIRPIAHRPDLQGVFNPQYIWRI